MTVSKNGSRGTLNSNLAKVDTHTIRRAEYAELLALTDEDVCASSGEQGRRPKIPQSAKTADASPAGAGDSKVAGDRAGLADANGRPAQSRASNRGQAAQALTHSPIGP